MGRIAIILIAVVFNIACQTSTRLSGAYVLESPLDSLQLDLSLNSDRTYRVSSINMMRSAQQEQGTWKMVDGDLVLDPTSGQIQHPVRRLRPDPQRPGRLLWIAHSNNSGGALQYLSFKPTASTRTQKSP